jgi:hypothetical protein
VSSLIGMLKRIRGHPHPRTRQRGDASDGGCAISVTARPTTVGSAANRARQTSSPSTATFAARSSSARKSDRQPAWRQTPRGTLVENAVHLHRLVADDQSARVGHGKRRERVLIAQRRFRH